MLLPTMGVIANRNPKFDAFVHNTMGLLGPWFRSVESIVGKLLERQSSSASYIMSRIAW